MKNFTRILLMFVVLLFQVHCLMAQVTIGSGTSTQRDPFNYFYGYGRSAAIYTSSEMNTTASGGTITTISWYSSLTSGWVTGPTIIYLKAVGSTTTVASATWATTISGATQVYSGTPTWVNGWNSIDITDFAIAANQNLEVLVECNYGGSGTSPSTSNSIRYTTGTSGTHAYWQADTSPPTGTSTNSTARPNVILGGLVPPAAPNCATLNTPSNGATGVIRNTALSWTPSGSGGTPTGYKVYLGTSTNPSLVTTVSHPTTTYTPSGQTYSTTYYWRIIPTNATGDAMGCSTEFSYTTEAAPAAPANDLCSNASGIMQTSSTTATYSGTLTAATSSSPALLTCGNSSAGVDVWYAFTSTGSGTVQFNVEADGENGSASFDSQIQIFSGACPSASTSCLAQGDDGGNPIGDSNDPPTISIAVTSGTTYRVRIYNWSSSTTGNFNLQVITPSGVTLPLELTSFTGKAESSSNMLQWETLSEKNVQYHIVERSVDGTHWTEVGRKAGQTESHTSLKYELEDRTPPAKAYYRLRSVDSDGQENLSNSIILTRKGDHFAITAAFPSPANDQVTVQFASLTEENVRIAVMDLHGRLVLEQRFDAQNGINEVPVQIGNLQAGVYLVSISNATTKAAPVRIVKK